MIYKGLRNAFLLILLSLLKAGNVWAADPRVDAAIIKEGVEKLEAQSRLNALHDAGGESDKNSYVIVVEGEYIEQVGRKGVGSVKFEVLQRSNALNTSRGESSRNSYVLSLDGKYIEEKLSGAAVTLLSVSELDLLDGELRRMNSSTAAKRENAAVYVLVFNSWWVKLARLIPEDVSIKSLFSTTEYGAEEKKLNEVTGDFYKELGNLVLSQKLQSGMAEKRIGYVLGRVAFQKDAEKAREYFVNDISASGFTEQQDRLLEATVSQVAKMQGAGHYDRVSARLKVLGEGLEKALGTTGETFEKEREVLKNMSPRLVNKWKVELNDGTGVRTILESGEDQGTISLEFKNGKWAASIDLGKLKQKAGKEKLYKQNDLAETQKVIETAINEKINQAKPKPDGSAGAIAALETLAADDGGEFKSGPGLTWMEWSMVLTDAGASIYENATLPEAYWKQSNDKYEDYPLHTPPSFAGISDGVIDEVTGIAQLAKLGLEVVTDKQVRDGMAEAVKGLSVEGLKAAAVNMIEERKSIYTGGSPADVTAYTIGKDVVQVASVFYGGFAAKGKQLGEAVEETGGRVRKGEEGRPKEPSGSFWKRGNSET